MPPRDEAIFIERFIESISQLRYGEAKRLWLIAKRKLWEAGQEEQRRDEKFFDKGTTSYPEYSADRDYVPGVGGRIYYLTKVVELCQLTMDSRQEDAALLAGELAKALRQTPEPRPAGDLNPTGQVVNEVQAIVGMLGAGKKKAHKWPAPLSEKLGMGKWADEMLEQGKLVARSLRSEEPESRLRELYPKFFEQVVDVLPVHLKERLIKQAKTRHVSNEALSDYLGEIKHLAGSTLAGYRKKYRQHEKSSTSQRPPKKHPKKHPQKDPK